MASLICREMGWTWEEYRAQPQWFIAILLSMLQNEAEAIRSKAKS